MTILEWSKDRPGRSNAIFSADVVNELKSRPGEWGLVRVYNHHGLVKSRVARPEGVEIRIVRRENRGVRKLELWGRWAG